MAFKVLLISAFIAAASAVAVPIHTYHAPALVKAYAPIVKTVEYDAPAHYDFSYSVQDPHTGDYKSQSESRKGDTVHGSYSLIDADGYQRIVEYTADAHSGFNAVVHRQPTGIKVPVPAKVIAPIAKVVPYVHAAPVVHAVPKYASYAPVAKIAAPLAVGYGAAHVTFSGPAASYHY